MKRITAGIVSCMMLFLLCASAEELSSDQLNYIKGALFVPRDIEVTRFDCYESDDSDDYGQRMIVVNLYSNGEMLAGATLEADTLLPRYDIWEYSESYVNISNVDHERASQWSETDQDYLKGAFNIPWNAAVHCEVGDTWFWDGGNIWLTTVSFYEGEICVADSIQEEYLAGASIEADCNSVSMVRDLYMYNSDKL